MDVGIARGIGGDHVGQRIVLEGSTLNISHDGIALGHGGHLGIHPEGPPPRLADATERQGVVAKGLAKGDRHLGEGALIAGPTHEVVVLTLIVEHPAEAEVANGHHGGVEQSGGRTPGATGIPGLLWQPQAGRLLSLDLRLGRLFLVFGLGLLAIRLPLLHEGSDLLVIVPDRGLGVVVGQHGLDDLVVDGLQFAAQTPSLPEGAATGHVDNADGHLQVAMEKGAEKIGHGGKALGVLRRALLPANFIANLVQRLVPGVLPRHVAQTGKVGRTRLPSLAVEAAPPHVALPGTDPDLPDQGVADHYGLAASADDQPSGLKTGLGGKKRHRPAPFLVGLCGQSLFLQSWRVLLQVTHAHRIVVAVIRLALQTGFILGLLAGSGILGESHLHDDPRLGPTPHGDRLALLQDYVVAQYLGETEVVRFLGRSQGGKRGQGKERSEELNIHEKRRWEEIGQWQMKSTRGAVVEVTGQSKLGPA